MQFIFLLSVSLAFRAVQIFGVVGFPSCEAGMNERDPSGALRLYTLTPVDNRTTENPWRKRSRQDPQSRRRSTVLVYIETYRGKMVKRGIVDRGYRRKKTVNKTGIILPKEPSRKDIRSQSNKKRKQWRRRASILSLHSASPR